MLHIFFRDGKSIFIFYLQFVELSLSTDIFITCDAIKVLQFINNFIKQNITYKSNEKISE